MTDDCVLLFETNPPVTFPRYCAIESVHIVRIVQDFSQNPQPPNGCAYSHINGPHIITINQSDDRTHTAVRVPVRFGMVIWNGEQFHTYIYIYCYNTDFLSIYIQIV